MISRRTLGMVAGSGVLAGCGFRPVYRSTVSGSPGIAERALAATAVGVIPDRAGQLLREALQSRFGSDVPANAGQYVLSVDYSIAGEGIAVQADNSVTRDRLIARASYTLRTQAEPHETVTKGVARSVDSVNTIDQQLFAVQLGTEAAQVRLAGAIADQITLQLAAYFRRQIPA